MRRPIKRNGMLLFSFLLTLSIFCANNVFAQNDAVKGTVTDVNGDAVIGASVMVKGTGNGTSTDINGNYSLFNVKTNEVLIFSYLGLATQEIRFSGQSTQNVAMSENVEMLDEVVVVGYGSLSRRELSSSITQVNRENFLQGAVNNPMEMLQGKVAGLTINLTSPANPNSTGAQFQVRGAGSINASNQPLVIVDGILGADYQSLSSQDIESITVLKDAGSAAIYGTRGANGVILITTKRGSGREGSARITYDSWIGLNVFKAKPRVLTPQEYREKNRGADMGASTDWWDLTMRDGPSHDLNQYLSIDGSTRTGSYGLSVNYRNATGADFITDREEFGGRLQVQQRLLNNLLEVSGSLNYRRNTSHEGQAQWGSSLTTDPTMPVYNDDGTYYQPTSPTGASQPYSRLALADYRGENNRIMAYADAKLNILKKANQSLNLSTSYSINFNARDYYQYQPSTSHDSFWNGYKGNAYRENNKNWTNRYELLANYFLNLNDHDFKVVAGYSYDEINYESFDARNRNFAFDDFLWNNLGSGTYLTEGKASMSTEKTKEKIIGLFTRINYNWKNTLFASASYRHEGATKFGPDSKWGDFYAGSLAIELAKMPFMENYTYINSLKPRISYGVTGRSSFDPYWSLQTYGTRGQYYMDGTWVTGFRPSLNANSLLGWEKAIVTNIGIDFSFNNRIRGSLEWYDRQSKDLLHTYTAPQPPFLYSTIRVNLGTMSNRGVDFTLEGDILKSTPLKWTSGIVAGTGTTKLVKLADDIFTLEYLYLQGAGGTGSNDYHFRVQEGGKIGQYWAMEWTGDIDDFGNMYVYNKDGEPILINNGKADDKRLINKSAVPKLDLSWTNSFRYKKFDLDIFWRGAFGFWIYNNMKSGMGLEGNGTNNILLSAYDTDLKFPGSFTSSYFLEKGDYFKLDNITLGYNFKPKPNNYLDNLRVYVSARNIATITSYSGNDPSIVRVTGITPGIDNSGAYPRALGITFGVTMRLK